MSGRVHTQEEKAGVKNGILRAVFVVIAFIIEAILIAKGFSWLGKYSGTIVILARVAAAVLVIGIYSQKKSGSIKIPWIILIMAFPVIGVFLYLFIGLSGSTKRMKRRYEQIDEILFPCLKQDPDTLKELEERHISCGGMARYLLGQAGYPVYHNTSVTYYDDAAKALEAQKMALSKARKFIFMEYFAIEDADSWSEVLHILKQKVKEGVEVRVFYDDLGSIGFINLDFAKRLQEAGIQCRPFNPVTPVFNLFLNNRDHRKMTIIDGAIGFTGGYNMADEYFNLVSPFGHWKDTGIRLEGEAVRSMTATFLEMWNAVRGDDTNDADPTRFLTDELTVPCDKSRDPGFVQFYADTPMDKKLVGEDLYILMINRAQRYLYIMTPYLIITDEMVRALNLAARRGVDVRLITPGIPDKKLVYQLTRSYYPQLASDGVRIYEYTPGFCHAKMTVADDHVATCGTINFDYRSLYHHFENGCLMVDCAAIDDMKKDFEAVFPQCNEVTQKYASGRSAYLRVIQVILRLFSPLM